MDFSYLDKKEYRNIELLDESAMDGTNIKKSFFIRKYNISDITRTLHRHKYIQINYVKKGCAAHTVYKNTIDIVKGDIFIIPPYVPHVITPYEDKELEIIEFEFSTDFVLPMADSVSDLESYSDFAYLEPFIVVEEAVKPRFSLDKETRRAVEEILDDALLEYENKSPGFGLIIKAQLLKLLVITGRAFTKEISGTEYEQLLGKYKFAVNASIDFINENYSRDITLGDAAIAVGYSRSRFSYLFKSVTGQTFIEYLNRIRIENATEMLETDSRSVTEIAYSVGFNTISNFNKAFKLHMGVSPSEYRKLIYKN